MSATQDLGVSHVAIETLLRRIAAEVRHRRAERGALRGAFWGAIAAVAVLAAKGVLGDLAIPVALAAAGMSVLTGTLLSARRRITSLESARLADRAFGLNDRVATSLEYAATTQRSPLANALMADAEARVQAIEPRRIVRRTTPVEARFLGVPIFIAVILAWAPPIRGTVPWWPGALGSQEHAVQEDPAGLNVAENAAHSLAQQRDAAETADSALTAAGTPQSNTGEPRAAFKDHASVKGASDFSSFIKKGDDRLKMLEHAEGLPDLKTDTSASQYKKLMTAGNHLANQGANGLSPERLGKLLKELADLGKKNSDVGNEADNGLRALEEDETDEAFGSMQNALEKLRESENKLLSSKGLSSSSDKAGPSDKGGKGNDPESDAAKAKAAARLRSTPYTASLQGSRNGRPPSLEVRMTGRAGAAQSQLQYLGVIGEYQKMMEDAITQEQVPRDYRDQIRNYFKALGQR